MPLPLTITAIILAGGNSSRMGTDKGMVEFEGHPLIAHVISAIKKVTGEFLIITQHGAYEQFGTCYPDIFPGKGPLGGIYTGLSHSTTRKNLVVGCDMPFLTPAFLTAIIEHTGDEDVLLVEHKGMAEPLCSVYDIHCKEHFRALLEEGKLKITDALKGLTIRTISFDNESWFSGNELANLNNREELLKHQSKKNANS